MRWQRRQVEHRLARTPTPGRTGTDRRLNLAVGLAVCGAAAAVLWAGRGVVVDSWVVQGPWFNVAVTLVTLVVASRALCGFRSGRAASRSACMTRRCL
jgi:hypothetical protein